MHGSYWFIIIIIIIIIISSILRMENWTRNFTSPRYSVRRRQSCLNSRTVTHATAFRSLFFFLSYFMSVWVSLSCASVPVATSRYLRKLITKVALPERGNVQLVYLAFLMLESLEVTKDYPNEIYFVASDRILRKKNVTA